MTRTQAAKFLTSSVKSPSEFVKRNIDQLSKLNNSKMNELIHSFYNGGMPTQILSKMREIVFSLYENDLSSNSKEKEVKKFTGKIVENDVVLMEKGFQLPQEATRWCQKQLIDNINCIGIVFELEQEWERIDRNSAFAELSKSSGTVYKKIGNSSSKLGWGMKLKENKKSHFSKG